MGLCSSKSETSGLETVRPHQCTSEPIDSLCAASILSSRPPQELKSSEDAEKTVEDKTPATIDVDSYSITNSEIVPLPEIRIINF